MPTYVYACDKCGQQFEHFQSFKDAPLDTCICGESGSVRRVFQPVGIVFKGSGWYINDSRKGNSESSTSSSTSSSSAKSAKSDSSESSTPSESSESSKPNESTTSSSEPAASSTSS